MILALHMSCAKLQAWHVLPPLLVSAIELLQTGHHVDALGLDVGIPVRHLEHFKPIRLPLTLPNSKVRAALYTVIRRRCILRHSAVRCWLLPFTSPSAFPKPRRPAPPPSPTLLASEKRSPGCTSWSGCSWFHLSIKPPSFRKRAPESSK